jgi:hypothetical protein
MASRSVLYKDDRRLREPRRRRVSEGPKRSRGKGTRAASYAPVPSLRAQLPDAIPHELAVHRPIVGTTWSSFGALLIVVGAVLVLGDAASGGPTWGGTYAEPKGRAAVTLALVGSVLVVVGSSVLLAQGGVSLLAVGAVGERRR